MIIKTPPDYIISLTRSELDIDSDGKIQMIKLSPKLLREIDKDIKRNQLLKKIERVKNNIN